MESPFRPASFSLAAQLTSGNAFPSKRPPFSRRDGPTRQERNEVRPMKKLAIAGLLAAALSLTCLSQQKAAAWGCGGGEFNFSIGFSISGSWNCQPCCSPCCGGCGYSLCPDVSAYTSCGC